MNAFYKISISADYNTFFAWKDVNIERIDKSYCNTCGREIWSFIYYSDTSTYELMSENIIGARQFFSDGLQFTDAGERVFLISEKALNAFENEHVTGYDGYSKVNTCFSSELSEKLFYEDAPQYYKLNITGEIEFDFKAMCLKKKRVCPDCGRFDWNRLGFPKFQLDETTWDGSDLCRIQSCLGYTVCSEKLYSLISEHELTGFAFKRL